MPPDSPPPDHWPLGPPVLPELSIHRDDPARSSSSSGAAAAAAAAVPVIFSRPLPPPRQTTTSLPQEYAMAAASPAGGRTPQHPQRSSPVYFPRHASSAGTDLGALLYPPADFYEHSDVVSPRPDSSSPPPATGPAADAEHDPFFAPIYLADSAYMRQLQHEHDERRHAAPAGGQNQTQPQDQQSSDDREAGAINVVGGPLPLGGSHRGLAHAVVERDGSQPQGPQGPQAESPLTPLPSRWNRDDMWGGLDVEPGNVLRYAGPKSYHSREHEASAVRANHPMPTQCGIYYYEAFILDGERDDTTIAIGFATKSASLSRPVGWEPESWGYHGDDGRAFTAQNGGKNFGPAFNKGDVIGCGVNFKDNSAFFTKNGSLIGTPFADLGRTSKTKLYPAISLKKPRDMVKVNFGQEPFVFDIVQMTQQLRGKILDDVAATSTAQLEPSLPSETDLVQALVLQFLQHDGYVDTARALAEEMRAQKASLNVEPDVKVGGASLEDDEEANQRQRIRSAVLEGDMDKALKFTTTFYPKVLPAHEGVHFRLRCRKFIEMVRRASEMSEDAEAARASSSPAAAKKHNGFAGLTNPIPSHKMDMDLDQGVSLTEAPADDDEEEEEEDEEEEDEEDDDDYAPGGGGSHVVALSALEQDILLYGRSLQADYGHHQERGGSGSGGNTFATGLEQIWALMAYKKPLREPSVAHLFDQQGRAEVAEELNSAILSSLGKSPRAAIEKVYTQTSVLLEELRANGGVGAFISVDDTVRGV